MGFWYGDTSDNLAEALAATYPIVTSDTVDKVSEARTRIQMNRALAQLNGGVPVDDVRSQLMDDRFDLASLLRVGDRLTMELHSDGTWSFELNNDYVPVVETGPHATLEDAARVLIRKLRGGT